MITVKKNRGHEVTTPHNAYIHDITYSINLTTGEAMDLEHTSSYIPCLRVAPAEVV